MKHAICISILLCFFNSHGLLGQARQAASPQVEPLQKKSPLKSIHGTWDISAASYQMLGGSEIYHFFDDKLIITNYAGPTKSEPRNPLKFSSQHVYQISLDSKNRLLIMTPYPDPNAYQKKSFHVKAKEGELLFYREGEDDWSFTLSRVKNN
ncbi:MAG: hypothetical protein P8M30_10620 [Planctomycetaceae bacterium]|jgi:hypothetical protein|nr:hypothetical protein [Planctomycetaceae bacterium]MDC0308209.1 hypothetical protein [Planctomycetaceae bacterium]MDG2389759.1 hypothetical protein [Planctomycetaceae bacterium]